MFGREEKKVIARKPVARDSMFEPTTATETVQPGSTVRLVAANDASHSPPLRHHGKRSLDGDDLAPALSSMDIGNDFGDSIADAGLPTPRTSDEIHRKIPRHSLEKPLPSPPNSDIVRLPDKRAAREREQALGVVGVVDLSNTEDTTIYERVAPAVTRETITPTWREIRQPVITREIHYHDVYHRVQPIIDFEIKPPRHFLKNADGSLTEIPESEAPVPAPSHLKEVFEAIYRDMLPKNQAPDGPRQFSARSFPGSEGDYREERTPEGTLKTEQWWVHPPTLEKDHRWMGLKQQPVPFHFESADPKDDGFRA